MSTNKYGRGYFIVCGLPPAIKVGIKIIQVELRITRAEAISLLYEEYNKKHKNDHIELKTGDRIKINRTAKKALAIFAQDTVRHRHDIRVKKRIL